MAGLDPATHAAPYRSDLAALTLQGRVDHRVKPGDDDVIVG